MKRKEPTKTFMMISNWKNPLVSQEYVSVGKVKLAELIIVIWRMLIAAAVSLSETRRTILSFIIYIYICLGSAAHTLWMWGRMLPQCLRHWPSSTFTSNLIGTVLPRKAERQYPLTCKVSRYCLLASHGSFIWSRCWHIHTACHPHSSDSCRDRDGNYSISMRNLHMLISAFKSRGSENNKHWLNVVLMLALAKH